MESVILTGAAGWLGRGLVHALRQGQPDVAIRALVMPGDPAPDGVEGVTGDLREPSACREIVKGGAGAVLLHAAGVIHPRRVREFYEVRARIRKHAHGPES